MMGHGEPFSYLILSWPSVTFFHIPDEIKYIEMWLFCNLDSDDSIWSKDYKQQHEIVLLREMYLYI